MTERDQEILIKKERELNLKQLQIKSLLAITQAINDNVSADGLYNMYRSFMSWEMGVQKMALFIKEADTWRCVVEQNTEVPFDDAQMESLLQQYTRLHTIKKKDPKPLKAFDIIIPVYHKKTPIAYALVGGIKEQEDIYNKIEFITTITNIIAVALENKRLFKQQVEQEALKREMDLASKVQRMLIPDELPNGEGFELDAIYQPHNNIGGDYFDIIRYDKKRLAFCIADISGKGIAAALLMANFQANLQSLIYQYRDLATCVIALNQAVYRITRGDKYITLFIAELNLREKKLSYINAGHFPPFLKMNGKLVRLDIGCTVIGAFDHLPELEMGEIELEGDGLILTFTDGLTDLQNEAGEYFEDEHIEQVIAQNGYDSARAFNHRLLQTLDTFRGNRAFPDDIAVLTCRFETQS
ncbi:MAG: SpoIIE family protein phosphatase [Saprospiraceae bacterium]|nr:SpoIIE family protein phosphatase [Saprospiraceae bacterium]